MTRPLRAMDKAATLLDQIEAVNALAVTAEVATLNLKPLARMDAEAAIRRLFAKLSEISVASGGDSVARPGPFEDLASAIVQLEHTIVTVTETVEGGDEDSLPLVSMDFVTGTYTVNGSPVAIGTLLEAQSETVGSEFDPADIVPGSGLKGALLGGSSIPSVVGDALDALLGTIGSTVVIEWSHTGGDALMFWFDVFGQGVAENWDTDIPMIVQRVGGNYQSGDSVLAAFSSGAAKVAMTVSITSTKYSVNGGAVVDVVHQNTPERPWSELTHAWFNTIHADYLRKVDIYAPQSDATLQSLSALE